MPVYAGLLSKNTKTGILLKRFCCLIGNILLFPPGVQPPEKAQVVFDVEQGGIRGRLVSQEHAKRNQDRGRQPHAGKRRPSPFPGRLFTYGGSNVKNKE